MSTNRIAVVTGSNSGFGRLTVEMLLQDGWRVFGTMRNTASNNAEAAASLGARGADVVELDVTNDASVDAAAAKVLAAGVPDLVVNNAGAAYFGIEEAFTPAAVERQFAINVFGPLRVNRAFLPAMRERRAGLIVYVSSVVGRMTFPLGGVYASSKWALEALAEASSYELVDFGVDVAIVQPGAFATDIGSKVVQADDTARAKSYGDVAQKLFGGMAMFGTASEGRDPGDVARAIVRLANLPSGMRPLRTTVPDDRGVESLNEAAVPVQAGMLKAMGLEDLLPKVAAV